MSALRIDVADLLKHSGNRRSVALAEELDGLTTSVATAVGPVALDLVLEPVPEGIVVRGTLHARWIGECGNCLRPLTQELEGDVDELFETAPIEGETYLLDGHELDLEQLVRDAVVPALPLAPRCEEACAPVATLPEADDDDDEDTDRAADPRWAVLSDLEL